MLSKKDRNYTEVFRTSKASHTTVQKALNELLKKKFINKKTTGYKKVSYSVTEKGKLLLAHLSQVKVLVK